MTSTVSSTGARAGGVILHHLRQERVTLTELETVCPFLRSFKSAKCSSSSSLSCVESGENKISRRHTGCKHIMLCLFWGRCTFRGQHSFMKIREGEKNNLHLLPVAGLRRGRPGHNHATGASGGERQICSQESCTGQCRYYYRRYTNSSVWLLYTEIG